MASCPAVVGINDDFPSRDRSHPRLRERARTGRGSSSEGAVIVSARGNQMRYTRISWQRGSVAAATLCLMGCAVGPDYHKPAVQIPDSFKEGVDWQRAQANPQGSLSSTWWLDYHDEQLSKLIDEAFRANQSIIAAEAAYRVAKATVSASVAALYPTVSANVSGTRAEYGSAASSSAADVPSGVYHYVTTSAAASWELDLWGKTRRQIESSKANARVSACRSRPALRAIILHCARLISISIFFSSSSGSTATYCR